MYSCVPGLKSTIPYNIRPHLRTYMYIFPFRYCPHTGPTYMYSFIYCPHTDLISHLHVPPHILSPYRSHLPPTPSYIVPTQIPSTCTPSYIAPTQIPSTCTPSYIVPTQISSPTYMYPFIYCPHTDLISHPPLHILTSVNLRLIITG